MAPNANETLRRRMRPRADASTTTSPTTTTPTTTTRRPRARRRWATSTVACVVGAAVAAARLPAAMLVDAAAATYVDGVTYCWQVGGSAYASDFNASVAVARAQQDECALALALQLSKDAFVVGEAVEASWTATLRRDAGSGAIAANRFGVEQLFVAPDRLSQKPYEILFSRVESCVAGAADCDPVTGHTDLIATVPNRPANFTSAGLALFSTDRIAFTSAGNVTLVAHLILPGGENAEQARLDFAFFKTISVTERPTLSPVRNESGSSQSDKSGSEPKEKGLSTEVIGIMFVCGMVAVALVAVGFVMIRKNQAELVPPPAVQKRADGRSTRNASTTDLDDEFAMLSNEERFMQSQRGSKKGNGFLTATTRGPQPSMLEESRAAAKAKAEAPLPYVGHASTRGGPNPRAQPHHPGDADLASDDHIVDPSNPASMRHHGLYMEMPAPPPPSRRTGPSQIYFNDIGDDEIIGHQHAANQSRRGPGMMGASMASSMASTANPFVAGREPRLGVADRLGSPLGGGVPGEPGDWRVSTELTFDDLRPSADLGPALTLDDLLENQQQQQQQQKRGAKSDSTSEE